MAGLRRADPERRLAIAWFDAHGDCEHARRRRRPGTCGGCRSRCCSVTARPTSSRRATGRLSSCATPRCSAGRCWTRRSRAGCRRRRSRISARGCSRRPAECAALRAWAEAVAAEVDGLYIAVDHDVLDADEADWAVTMPEPGGLRADLAVELVRGPCGGDPGRRLRRHHDELRGRRRRGADRRRRRATGCGGVQLTSRVRLNANLDQSRPSASSSAASRRSRRRSSCRSRSCRLDCSGTRDCLLSGDQAG